MNVKNSTHKFQHNFCNIICGCLYLRKSSRRKLMGNLNDFSFDMDICLFIAFLTFFMFYIETKTLAVKQNSLQMQCDNSKMTVES